MSERTLKSYRNGFYLNFQPREYSTEPRVLQIIRPWNYYIDVDYGDLLKPKRSAEYLTTILSYYHVGQMVHVERVIVFSAFGLFVMPAYVMEVLLPRRAMMVFPSPRIRFVVFRLQRTSQNDYYVYVVTSRATRTVTS